MKTNKTKFKDYRELNNLYQKDIAKIIGIAPTTYAAYEQEAAQADYQTLLTLSKYYGVTINQLLGESNENLIIISKAQYEDLVNAKKLLDDAIAKIAPVNIKGDNNQININSKVKNKNKMIQKKS